MPKIFLAYVFFQLFFILYYIGFLDFCSSVIRNNIINTRLRRTNKTRIDEYNWFESSNYYYPSVEYKMITVLGGNCNGSYQLFSYEYFPILNTLDSDEVKVFWVKENKRLRKWWLRISPPKQMRTDPWLCEEPYRKSRQPIFNNSRCVSPHLYMLQSAPRCQIEYLKWSCERSKIDINVSIANGFVLPESRHLSTIPPPTPFLIVAHDSFITM